jgi:hypothetical protein
MVAYLPRARAGLADAPRAMPMVESPLSRPTLMQRTLPPAVAWVAAFVFYFSVIAAILSGYAFCGFIGDAAAYVARNTHEYSTHPLLPYLTVQDTGHPLIFAWLNGLLWRAWGIQPLIANVSIWLYAALALTALQFLAQNVVTTTLGARAPRWAGLAAALCLLSTPLFIANTAQYVGELPHLAFNLMMLAAWYRRRRGWLTFWAFLLTFTRITGCLAVLGLGLFDLGRELRAGGMRRPRRLFVLMLPYLICGLLFAVYLTVKLWVLGRPLTTIEVNEAFAGGSTTLLGQAGIILAHTFNQPRYSFGLLAIPAAIALGLHGWRRFALRSDRAGDAAVGISNAALYSAFAAVAVVPALLYALHDLWPQPRWFLIHHALIVLLGVHGLFCLAPRSRATVAAILIAWCSLQILRWQPSWIRVAFSAHPKIQQQLIMYPPLTLNEVHLKRLYHRLAEWYERRPLRSAFFLAAWPTTHVLDRPQSGFIRDTNQIGAIDRLAADPDQLTNLVLLANAQYDDLYLLYASADAEQIRDKTLEVLARHPAFRIETLLRDEYGNEIRIYRYDADAAARDLPGALARQNFAARLYRILLGRTIDVSAFESWGLTLSRATDKRTAAAEAIKALAASPEFQMANPTSELRVSKLHEALLDRPATPAELQRWIRQLDSVDNSMNDLIDRLSQAPEFQALVARFFPPGE